MDQFNFSLHDDHPHEECGVLGIFAPDEDVARMAFFGLFALQHRGQEAAGLAVSNGHSLRLHKDIGLVSQVFTPDVLETMQGDFAIGHTRYSTTGSPTARNSQPFMIDTQYGPLALAHNGNLVNAGELREKLMHSGVGLTSTSDTEVMIMMLAGAQGDTWFERLQDAMQHWVGAYSLVLLTKDQVFAVRDPWGVRPLSVGILPNGGHVAASESGALYTLGCEAIREVQPGEIVALSNTALQVNQALQPAKQRAFCTFEHVYFSRPDAYWDNRSVHTVRHHLGEMLAKQAPVEADVVIPIPDSSISAAIGYAQQSGIPYDIGFIKNRYIGRTFIEPTDYLRKQGVSLKYNVVLETVRDKRIIMVDDSIVRGNTTGPLIQLLRNSGAKEVHVRISCPPIRYPCYLGVDMGTYEELIAAHKTVEEIREHVGADSLEYLSLENMMKSIGREDGYCNACYTGKYPMPIQDGSVKTSFENHIE
jgi:amidophosphoribosyltransferase